MSRRVLFNEKYGNLRDEVLSIVDNFENVGTVIYRGHNLIKTARAGGLEINIKRYRVPHVFNRVVYSFIRRPKGLRAFTYPDRLLRAGIETPEPIAYVEERIGGLIGYSYLVTVQMAYTRDFYEFGDKDMTDPADVAIVRALARYAARMHQAGILHRDFSPGNIIFDTDASKGEPKFAVVDINRMSFGPVSATRGIRNLARLWGQPLMFDIMAEEYARARGADPAEMARLLHAERRRVWTRYSRRHKVKFNLRFK